MWFVLGSITSAFVSLYALKNTFYGRVIWDVISFNFKSKITHYLDVGKLESTKHKYTLTYTHGTKTYKHVFPKKRGPQPIIKAESDGKDVTSEFLEYLGPGNNFHGSKPTPDLLGFEKGLTLTIKNGEQLYYGQFEIL